MNSSTRTFTIGHRLPSWLAIALTGKLREASVERTSWQEVSDRAIGCWKAAGKEYLADRTFEADKRSKFNECRAMSGRDVRTHIATEITV